MDRVHNGQNFEKEITFESSLQQHLERLEVSKMIRFGSELLSNVKNITLKFCVFCFITTMQIINFAILQTLRCF